MAGSIVRGARTIVGPIAEPGRDGCLELGVAETIWPRGLKRRINRPDIWMQAIHQTTQTSCATGPSTYGSLLVALR